MPEHRRARQTDRTAPETPRYASGGWQNAAQDRRELERQRRRDRISKKKGVRRA